MTEPVTFGDLLDQARRHLDAAGRVPGRPGSEVDLLDATRGMHAVITVIGQYFGDILTKYPKPSDRGRRAAHRSPGPTNQWAAAFLDARRASLSAAQHIEPATVLRRTGALASERGQHLNAAAQALVAGRDLLHMHAATKPDGDREDRSSWAPVISAPAFSRVIAAEMAALARQAAAVGSALVTVPAIGWDQTTDSRKAMHNASQRLRILHGAIQAARQQYPVEAVDRELLRAVPARLTPVRRLPDGTENLTNLCKGVITAAERLRRSARQAVERNFRSPELNVESLRLAAAASVAITDNCAFMLTALAEAPEMMQSEEAAAEVTGAVDSAKQARDCWLSVAHELGQFTSDVDGHISAEAADAHDLALWTGRLAYADPTWTPANNSNQTRCPATLAIPTPDVAAAIVAVVHHATDSLEHLVVAHQLQAQLAARGRRLLVLTASLPAGYSVASRFSPAPPYRAGQLMAQYKYAENVSRRAAKSVASVAEVAEASSRTLTRAAEVAQEEANQDGRRRNASRGRRPAKYDWPNLIGPVEQSLLSLGVVDQRRLSQAAAIDRAGEQLIIDSCAVHPTDRFARAKIPAPMQRLEKTSFASQGETAIAHTRASRIGELEREL